MARRPKDPTTRSNTPWLSRVDISNMAVALWGCRLLYPHALDKLKLYHSYSSLKEREKIGYDYDIRKTFGRSAITVMAPHGGKIEPGTSEIAEAIAGLEYDFYAFEGLKKSGNMALHITSTSFDEPQALYMAVNSETVLTVHGYRGSGEKVFVGGLFAALRERIRDRLAGSGFQTGETSHYQGSSPSNMCNRCRSRGVQLELTRGLRSAMFHDKSLRSCTSPTDLFLIFVQSVRSAISEYALALSRMSDK